MYVFARWVINSEDSNPFTLLLHRITPLLISRFLLNLRQLGEDRDVNYTGSPSEMSGPIFTLSQIITGNIGGQLDHNGFETDSPRLSDDSRNTELPL